MSGEQAVEPRALTVRPLSLLPNSLLEPRRPLVVLAVAWLTTFLPSILLGALVAAFAPESAQPQFQIRGAAAMFALVIFAPVLETLIMGGALLVLLRLFNPTVAVLLSSLGWGIAHSLAAPVWGLIIWWPFLIFSTLFVVWRQRSLSAAFAMPMVAHGLHNLLPAILVASGIQV